MSKLKGRYIFALIIVLHVLAILYWGNVKTNYYIDELFSFGYASNFTEMGDTAQYITTSPEFQWNTWISNADLKKYLIVSEEEELLHAPAGEVVQKLLTGRNYFAFLNLAESIAGNGTTSVWPVLILNSLFAVLTDLAFLSLLKKLCMDERTRLLALAMFVFSGYMLSAAVYVRFYQLVILLMMLTLNLFALFWTSDSLRRMLPASIGMLMLVYFSYKNSELTIAFFGALMGCTFLASLFLKRWKHLAAIGGMGAIGALYVGFCTDYLNVLIHPNHYENAAHTNAAANTSESIAAMDLGKMKGIIDWGLRLFFTHFFAMFWMGLLLIAAAAVCHMISHKQSRTQNTALISFTVICCLNALFFWRFDHVMMATANLLFAIAGLLYLKRIEDGKITLRAIRLSQPSQIVLIFIGMAIIYSGFGALASFQLWRYYWPVYPTAFIIFWYAIDRYTKHCVLKENERRLFMVLAVFVAINAMLPFATRNIMYLYEDETDFVANIQSCDTADVILYIGHKNGTDVIVNRQVYDCVNLISEDANIYILDADETAYQEADYPRGFLLWSAQGRDLTEMFDLLTSQGYTYEKLGTDHDSQVYICNRLENSY